MNIPLNIDWQQILLHLLNFVILAGGLYLLLYKPVKTFMEKRQQYYQEQDAKAAKTLADAEKTAAEVRQQLKNADADAAAKLAAALVLALGSVAYASDLGGIQRTVQLWLNGEMTDATLTVKNGHYTVNYTDSEGNERERSGGGVAFEPDGTERALTEEELLADINCPEVTYRDDGTVTVYYLDQKLDVTDKFDEDGVCYVQLEGGEKTIYMTIKRGNGYATSTTKYILPNEFNN